MKRSLFTFPQRPASSQQKVGIGLGCWSLAQAWYSKFNIQYSAENSFFCISAFFKPSRCDDLVDEFSNPNLTHLPQRWNISHWNYCTLKFSQWDFFCKKCFDTFEIQVNRQLQQLHLTKDMNYKIYFVSTLEGIILIALSFAYFSFSILPLFPENDQADWL